MKNIVNNALHSAKLLALILFLSSFTGETSPWLTDYSKAQEKARTENKLILLNFSGSDWCLPCIRLHKDVFESQAFSDVAGKLVLVNADFPRQKKHQQPEILSVQNKRLAEQYNPDGQFPLTLLLDASGREIKRWVGEVGDPAAFSKELRRACTAGK